MEHTHLGVLPSVATHDSTLEILLGDIHRLTNSNRAILDSIARFAQLSLPQSRGDEEENLSPGDNKDEEQLELLSMIQDGLKRQEDNVEITTQKLSDFWSTPAFVNSRSGIAATQRARLGNGIETKEQLSLRIARLSEDLKRARSRFRRVQLQANAGKRVRKQTETKVFRAAMSTEFSPLETPKSDNASNVPSTDPIPRSTTRGLGLATDKISKSQLSHSSSHARRGTRTGKQPRESVRTSAAEQVTSALQETLELLKSELSRSYMARQTFEESSEGLRHLTNQYSTIDNILTSSRSLVSTLLSSQKSDTWYLEAAFYMLIATVGWLVFRRLLYGPAWWFIWLPLKMLFRISWLALSGVRLLSNKKTEMGALVPSSELQISSAPVTIMAMPDDGKHVRGVNNGVEESSESSERWEGSLSESIATMVMSERSAITGISRVAASAPAPSPSEPVRRGDGQVLRDSDEPRNAKKRMWEEPIKKVDPKLKETVEEDDPKKENSQGQESKEQNSKTTEQDEKHDQKDDRDDRDSGKDEL